MQMTGSVPTIDVRAEWPGRVAEIHVAVSDLVTTEQELATLESMKMLTPILAPDAGQVTEILVAVDDFVDEGAVIARLAI
jgi:acetyl-CoA carboxylase biotin carboxyl carrier protein